MALARKDAHHSSMRLATWSTLGRDDWAIYLFRGEIFYSVGDRGAGSEGERDYGLRGEKGSVEEEGL